MMTRYGRGTGKSEDTAKAFTLGVGSFPSRLALLPTVEMPTLSNSTSETQVGPSHRNNIGNRSTSDLSFASLEPDVGSIPLALVLYL